MIQIYISDLEIFLLDLPQNKLKYSHFLSCIQSFGYVSKFEHKRTCLFRYEYVFYCHSKCKGIQILIL